MSIKMRQEVEKKIASALIEDGLKAGYLIGVDNGGDEMELKPCNDKETILKAMFLTDEEHLIFDKDGKQTGWVFFVYGNDGWDVISDYSVNLEHVMTGANKVSKHYQ